MTTNECRDRLRLAALAAAQRNEHAHEIANAVMKLYRNARTVAKINLDAGNTPGGETPQQARRKAAAVGRMAEAVGYLFGGLVVRIEADGDPRGCSVKLLGLPFSNDMGGDWGLA